MYGLQKLTNALSNGTIPDPLWPPLHQDWGFATQLPLLPQEKVKLQTLNFVGPGSIGTKAHEKCWEQQPWAQSGSPENFQGTHVQGALRGYICDSTAFLLTFNVQFYSKRAEQIAISTSRSSANKKNF